jgi:hypothetical protein
MRNPEGCSMGRTNVCFLQTDGRRVCDLQDVKFREA